MKTPTHVYLPPWVWALVLLTGLAMTLCLPRIYAGIDRFVHRKTRWYGWPQRPVPPWFLLYEIWFYRVWFTGIAVLLTLEGADMLLKR